MNSGGALTVKTTPIVAIIHKPVGWENKVWCCIATRTSGGSYAEVVVQGKLCGGSIFGDRNVDPA